MTRHIVHDQHGQVAAAYCGRPLDDEGRAHMLNIVDAARRRYNADNADGQFAARQAAARERNHQRLIRLGLHRDDCAYCRCRCGTPIPRRRP